MMIKEMSRIIVTKIVARTAHQKAEHLLTSRFSQMILEG
jgi:hypothetical protein